MRHRRLFVRWQQDGDHAARDELFERFAPLARSLARRYGHTSEPYDDLCQVAHLGLVKAIDGYDPDRGFAFAAYAVPTILGELRRHFRSSSWTAHVPRAAQERALGSVSLDAPRAGEAGDDEGSYVDAIGSEDERYELVELGADVVAALQRLEPRQREILGLRFFAEMTQTQIAERIGVSQMQVSRLLAKCVSELQQLTAGT